MDIYPVTSSAEAGTGAGAASGIRGPIRAPLPGVESIASELGHGTDCFPSFLNNSNRLMIGLPLSLCNHLSSPTERSLCSLP